MDSIIFDLNNDDPHLVSLKSRLYAQQFRLITGFPKVRQNWKDALLITEREESIAEAARVGLACIGYENPSQGRHIRGVSTVLQGFEGIDGGYLERMYQRFHGIPWEIAENEEIRIRESVKEDFDALYDICQQPGISRYMPGMEQNIGTEREIFLAYIRHIYPLYDYGMWTVMEKKSGEVIGRAGLEEREYQGSYVLCAGYMIGLPWQGRGYGGMALHMTVEYAAVQLDAQKIFAFIHPENHKSAHLAEKQGFMKTGEDVWCLPCARIEQEFFPGIY